MIREIIPRFAFLLLPFIIVSCSIIDPYEVKNTVKSTRELSFNSELDRIRAQFSLPPITTKTTSIPN